MYKRVEFAGPMALCIFTLAALMLGGAPVSAAPAPTAKDPQAAPPKKKRRPVAAPRAVRPAEADPDEREPPAADVPYGDKDVDDEGKAKQKPHVVKTKVRTELSVGVLYDDNAALGRRGQFGADQVYDVTSILGVDSRLQTDIRRTVRFVLTGKLRAEEARWRQYLRNTDISVKPALELDLSANMTLTPSVNFKLHRETEEIWGYLEVAPSLLFMVYTKVGLIFEASYDFTATRYDSDELTNTYANVNRLSHLAKLRLKIWQTQRIRWGVKLEAEHQTFDNNIEEKLAHIMFAPIDDFENPDLVVDPYDRKDVFLRAELEFLFLARKDFAVALGYRFEWDMSNLDPFNNRSHGPRLALVFSRGIHQVFGEARLSMVDFYDFRYDTRFSNTRKDLKLEGFATYQITINEVIKLGAKVTFLSNFSNDARDDDNGVPFFDPRHSRSYSRYQGTRIELMFTYLWDTQKGAAPPAPTPEPKLPGTIMAQR
jgi:hypothetical protein